MEDLARSLDSFFEFKDHVFRLLKLVEEKHVLKDSEFDKYIRKFIKLYKKASNQSLPICMTLIGRAKPLSSDRQDYTTRYVYRIELSPLSSSCSNERILTTKLDIEDEIKLRTRTHTKKTATEENKKMFFDYLVYFLKSNFFATNTLELSLPLDASQDSCLMRLLRRMDLK